MSYEIQDNSFIETKALPADAGSAAATSTSGFDLGEGLPDGEFHAECEVEVSAPALGSTAMPNGTEMHYDIEASSDDGDSDSYEVIAADVIVQTGADSSGDDAATARFRVPTDCERYLRVTAEGDDGTGTLGDCSGSDMTAKVLF